MLRHYVAKKNLIVSRGLARQMEYRADMQAVLHRPQLRQPLIDTLELLHQHQHNEPSFLEESLSDHPSLSARITRL